MIPTIQLGQAGQAYNQGRVAWRANGTTNMTFTHSTEFSMNLTTNQRDSGRNRYDPDLDRFLIPYAGWYAISAGYQTNAWPTANGYNGTLTGVTPPSPLSYQPGCWHENMMSTGYNAAKSVFCVVYAPAGSVTYFNGNQWSSSTVTVVGSSIYQTLLSLHDNMIPYGVDLIGAATSLGNLTQVPLTYTSAYRDDGAFWSGPGSTSLVVPTGAAGWYVMSGWYRLLNPTNGVGGARGYWLLNSSQILGGSSTTCDDGSKSPPGSALCYLNEGDALQFIANQNTGSTQPTERHRVGLTRVATTNGVCVSRSTGQSVAINSTVAASFDTEVRDDLNAWTISDPTKLTVPTGASGWYLISGTAWWAATTGFDRDIRLIVDGTTEIGRMQQHAPAIHNDPRLCVTTAYYLSEGQYVEMRLRNGHTSSAVSTQGTLSLSMVKVEI